jgi:hypothetical protein
MVYSKFYVKKLIESLQYLKNFPFFSKFLKYRNIKFSYISMTIKYVYKSKRNFFFKSNDFENFSY